MLLQKLKEYAERLETHDNDLEVAPDEYEPKAIPWILSLNSEGEQPHFIRTSGGRGKKDIGKSLHIPYLKRSGPNIKPQLLADAAESVLGLVTKDTNRAQKRHQEFTVLVEACAQVTQVSQARAVHSFLQHLDVTSLQIPEELKPTDFITFAVEGVYPIDIEEVQLFWAQIAPHLGQRGLPLLTTELVISWLGNADEGLQGQCVVCGKHRSIARIHPVAIKLPRSVSDQQLALVTAHKDKDAFHSYGLSESYVAPTCRPCAVSYARSINRLARNEQTHAIIGSSIFIGWPREDFGFDFFALLNDPARAAVDALQGIQAALFKGKPMPKIDTNVFYATILSASGARVVVRDWIECAVPNLIEHLNRWFAWQRIVAPTGEFERPLGIRALAGATVRDLKDLPTPTVRALFRTALVGVPLPHNLLQQAIQRCRADRDVKHYQAAMLKLVLASRHYFEEDSMEHLDLDRPDVAYRCGRLLAVLEAVQGKAIPGINRTLVNRFLGSAMTSPERVFIPLVKGAEDHLSKLARQSQKGTAVNLQKQLEEIMLGINKFPQTFTSEQQAMFILGFYHQRAHDRKAATDHKQAKAAEAAQRTLPFHDDADHETDTV